MRELGKLKFRMRRSGNNSPKQEDLITEFLSDTKNDSFLEAPSQYPGSWLVEVDPLFPGDVTFCLRKLGVYLSPTFYLRISGLNATIPPLFPSWCLYAKASKQTNSLA